MGKMSDSPAVIYAVRCTETGRIYIGSTTDIRQRLNYHLVELKGNAKRGMCKNSRGEPTDVRPEGSVWQMDYNKYGRDAFEAYILEENVAKKDRPAREDYWMEKYRTTDPMYGYNLRYETPHRHKMLRDGLPPLPPEEKREVPDE